MKIIIGLDGLHDTAHIEAAIVLFPDIDYKEDVIDMLKSGLVVKVIEAPFVTIGNCLDYTRYTDSHI
jgi:hypothetical protein